MQLFDFNLGSMDDFAQFLRGGSFDFVCISLRNIDDTNIFARNNFVAHYKQIMGTARANSAAPIIIGGPGFSVFPEQVFAALQPDYAIHGEGEESLRQLIDALRGGAENSRLLPSIDGLAYRDATGMLHFNSRTSHIAAPALHIDNRLAEFYWNKSGMLNIQTKRGCPYRCIYCSYPVIDGSRVRTLDAKTVVANIEELYHSKGISYLFFTDSIFNISKDYNHELAERLIAGKMKVRWGAYFSPHNMTRDDLALYQRSGLTHVEFGSDSFCDATLKSYGKKFMFSDIVEQSRSCEQLGIFYAHFLILGGFGETEDSLNQTFDNSKLVGPTVIFPYVGMRIYPHTKLFEHALREGVIADAGELINPVYYVAKGVDLSSLKERANATGQKWVFPNDEASPMIEKFREKKRRGPLWEYLRYGG
jgi:radical SAM superfamily enzyme YgiQ (UPF0313 family)